MGSAHRNSSLEQPSIRMFLVDLDVYKMVYDMLVEA